MICAKDNILKKTYTKDYYSRILDMKLYTYTHKNELIGWKIKNNMLEQKDILQYHEYYRYNIGINIDEIS